MLIVRSTSLLAVALGLTLLAASIPTVSSRAGPVSPQAAPPAGELRYVSIPAPSLAQSIYHTPTAQPAAVYLPPSYGVSEHRYPVVYFLPGFRDAIQMYTEWRFYQGFALKDAMDRMIAGERIREMIVVIANGENFLGGCFYVNSPVTGNWEDYVVRDLVGEIDRRFRTLPAPASRAVAGHSMGGTGALNLAMRHPDVFGMAYALSPGLAAPGGLTTHAMFDSSSVAQVLAEQDALSAMPDVDARTAFMSWVHLQGITFNVGPLFAFAYGAAFAPDPGGGAPFIRFPFRRVDGKPVEDAEIRAEFESGFGDLDSRAARYGSNLLKLALVTIDVGSHDEHGWIPPGCRYFAKVLRDRGVPVELLEYDGAHQSQLSTRLTEHMFPALSRKLAH